MLFLIHAILSDTQREGARAILFRAREFDTDDVPHLEHLPIFDHSVSLPPQPQSLSESAVSPLSDIIPLNNLPRKTQRMSSQLAQKP